jgi:hypothetical protein
MRYPPTALYEFVLRGAERTGTAGIQEVKVLQGRVQESACGTATICRATGRGDLLRNKSMLLVWV